MSGSARQGLALRLGVALTLGTAGILGACGGFDGFGEGSIERESASVLGTIARERPADDPAIKEGLRFVGPNPWPEGMPEFREAMIAYQTALSGLGLAMLPIYARALDLPPDYFEPYFTEPLWWTLLGGDDAPPWEDAPARRP